MKQVSVKLLFLSLFMFFFCLVLNVFSNSVKTHKTSINKVDVLKGENLQKVKLKVSKSYGKIPLYFIRNKGQVNEKALFYAKTSRYTLWITKEGLVFDSIVKEGKDNSKDISERKGKRKVKGRDVSRVIFKNYNKNLKVIPVDEAKYRVNYFKGNDKSKWIKNIETSKGILFKSIYRNIDLKIYGIEKEIEYDWILRKGGKTEDIVFEYKNAENTKIDKYGNIVIEMKFGKLKHKKPLSYQIGERGNRKYVESEFIKSGKNIYKIKTKKYDKRRDLIIDPVVLVYSTYLGGSFVDCGKGIAVDSNGCAYVSGFTQSMDFPVKAPYQGTFAGGNEDAFVTKLSFDGSSLVYSTYFGGSYDDDGRGIAVDSNGCAYVTGYTYSDNFPIQTPYQGTIAGSNDTFVTKLSSDGSSLVYSTYLGGGDFDVGEGIAVDNSECAYVSGYTDSDNFPTHNPYQGANAGGNDAFVTKLTSDGSSLVYSTYLGGVDWDKGRGIAVDSNGCAYVTGIYIFR